MKKSIIALAVLIGVLVFLFASGDIMFFSISFTALDGIIIKGLGCSQNYSMCRQVPSLSLYS